MAEDDRSTLKGDVREMKARLDAMDKALNLVQQWPTDLDKRLAQLEKVLAVKFEAIESIIAERDRLLTERTELLQRLFQKQHDGFKELLDQQFHSSQRAVEKSESSMREQLTKVEEVNTTLNQALSDRITQVKDNLNSLESRMKGASNLWSYLLGAAGLLLIFLGFIYSIR